ncbi:hypothetical protein BDM02DRAFT_3115610 [Thelephora ganbajun]|uniref:Uncharacterized protein n=1 Tax=Thelephora ganbajun TaxID=370292 RepID=A0ACB6ZEW9_THEGA|nr:hypothetical protein BDM02DRAFT_3115610 [Thelephora ganbajun]
MPLQREQLRSDTVVSHDKEPYIEKSLVGDLVASTFLFVPDATAIAMAQARDDPMRQLCRPHIYSLHDDMCKATVIAMLCSVCFNEARDELPRQQVLILLPGPTRKLEACGVKPPCNLSPDTLSYTQENVTFHTSYTGRVTCQIIASSRILVYESRWSGVANWTLGRSFFASSNVSKSHP